MSILREKSVERREQSDVKRGIHEVIERGEGLFNVLMARYGGAGPFSMFTTKSNRQADMGLAQELVEEYEDLRALVYDYDETIRYQTTVLDKLQNEMKDLNRKMDYLIGIEKENKDEIKKFKDAKKA